MRESSVSPLATLLLATIALAGGACGPDDTNPNPDVLWLALDGSETQVRLIATEPTRY